jgi:hypothetical protein
MSRFGTIRSQRGCRSNGGYLAGAGDRTIVDRDSVDRRNRPCTDLVSFRLRGSTSPTVAIRLENLAARAIYLPIQDSKQQARFQ